MSQLSVCFHDPPFLGCSGKRVPDGLGTSAGDCTVSLAIGPDPCTPPDPSPTSVRISRQRFSEGSDARWALDHNLRKLTLRPLRVAHSSAGRWGRGQKALPPLCTENTEAQGRGAGGRADRRRGSLWECPKRTLAAQGSQSVFPDDSRLPRAPPDSGIKVTGRPGAALTLAPKDSHQFGYQLPHGTPGARGLRGSAASVWPQIFKAPPGGGPDPLHLSDVGNPKRHPRRSGNPTGRWPLVCTE